jgi:hypothetical protein
METGKEKGRDKPDICPLSFELDKKGPQMKEKL